MPKDPADEQAVQPLRKNECVEPTRYDLDAQLTIQDAALVRSGPRNWGH